MLLSLPRCVKAPPQYDTAQVLRIVSGLEDVIHIHFTRGSTVRRRNLRLPSAYSTAPPLAHLDPTPGTVSLWYHGEVGKGGRKEREHRSRVCARA